jgi:integrase
MPSIKLTEKSVERIPLSSDSPVEYYDTKLTGFGVRAGKKTRTYFVKGRAATDEQFKRKIGKVGLISFDDAQKKALEILKDAEQGVSPDKRAEQEIEADIITLRTVLKKYLETRKKLKPRTTNWYNVTLERYLSDWLDLPMRSITPDQVMAKHIKIGEKSKAEADGTFRIVRALFNFAMDIYEEIIRNPVRRLSSVKAWYKVPRKKTFIKPSQLPAFFNAVQKKPGLVSDYMAALLFTGIRSASEIAKLEIQHVDFKERAFSLYDTKSQEWLYIPMCKSTEAILKRRVDDAKAQGTSYLFYAFQEQAARNGKYKPKVTGGYIKDVRGTIKIIFQDTELADIDPRTAGHMVTPHDLRRTFLTYADELGISNVVQKRLVGHAIPTDVTDGYIVLTMERLMSVVEQIEAFILEKGKQKPIQICP